MLCSNNYHGFTNDARVISRAKQALDEYGSGLGSGRGLVSMKIQLELEDKIAKFKHAESALTFQTGYDANLSAAWTLPGNGDFCILDELNHQSVFDGLQMGMVKKEVYAHRNMTSLHDTLERVSKTQHRQIFVITPGVFPLEGDIAPLKEIVELADRYSATVYVDDSHGTGVLGANGSGTVEHFGLEGQIEIQSGSFSKALASMGGFIVGPKEVRDYLFKKARPFTFATGHIAPASVAAAIAALEIIQNEGSFLLEKLRSNAKYFKEGIRALGFDTGVASESPITPIVVGDENMAVQFREMLFEEGVYVYAFGYPSVPKGKARLRTIVSSAHTREELGFCLDAFAKVGKRLSVIAS